MLIEAGADLNTKDKIGWSALSLAALKDHADIVKILIEAGADMNSKDKDGRSALSLAAYNDRVGKVKLLIEAGADINTKIEDGRSALYLAVDKGYAKIVKMLIEAGADLNTKDKDGRSALSWAVDKYDSVGLWLHDKIERHRDIVKMIIEAGSSLAFLDDDRKLESFARKGGKFSKHPVIVDAVEREKRWRRHEPFVTFVEWLNKLEDPPALPVVAALLSGGPIMRQIAKFV